MGILLSCCGIETPSSSATRQTSPYDLVLTEPVSLPPLILTDGVHRFLSPVHGNVEKSQFDRLEIYIPADGDHTIYAPVSGTVTNLAERNGIFYPDKDALYFKQRENTGEDYHTAECTVEIDHKFTFSIRVGKPQFITDTIRWDVTIGSRLKQGFVIGEILIGSEATVFLPEGYHWQWPQTRQGETLTGGVTVLAVMN